MMKISFLWLSPKRPHLMANIFVFITVTFNVYSFNMCVYSQTLQTFANLILFMVCPITEDISKSKSLRLYISWAFFTLKPIDHGLKCSRTPKLVELKVQEILCESNGLLPPLMDDFVVEHMFIWLPHGPIHVVTFLLNKGWCKVQNFDMESTRNCWIWQCLLLSHNCCTRSSNVFY